MIRGSQLLKSKFNFFFPKLRLQNEKEVQLMFHKGRRMPHLNKTWQKVSVSDLVMPLVGLSNLVPAGEKIPKCSSSRHLPEGVVEYKINLVESKSKVHRWGFWGFIFSLASVCRERQAVKWLSFRIKDCLFQIKIVW